ncbi:WRKY transcription factor 44 [Abeliophyllum distichum]|uniref:WRKY transcription factor 44 n=1 Tax=Abeliophyllum distichum TaxID=126358 RepID=A0ABD1RBX0_9LAMI
MEIKEAEKIVIAKPVASRPDFSSFRSFTELLAGAIDASPHNALSETAVAAIKPRTMRFKPAGNHNFLRMDSFEAELSGSEDSHPSDNVLKSDITSSVIYKPIAKLVSKSTISVLANLGQPMHRANSMHPASVFLVHHAEMLVNLDIPWVILGHSERRALLNESNENGFPIGLMLFWLTSLSGLLERGRLLLLLRFRK